MRRKRHRKDSKKYIILPAIFLLFLFSVGYSAFSSEFLISGKGTIIEKDFIHVGGVIVETVTSGDGLYSDEYEEERYIYRGMSPNNYIKFNNELWRIISLEPDGTIKIIRNESIGKMQWDDNSRYNEENTYCKRMSTYEGVTQYWGCHVWAKVNGIYSTKKYSGTVSKDASLNTYLNVEYLNSLSNDEKYIKNHNFYIGDSLGGNDSIKKIYNSEKSEVWNGKVGLLNVSDFLKASTNENCLSIETSREESSPCSYENGNYLDELKKESWTINKSTTIVTMFTEQVKTFSAYFSNKTVTVNGGVSGYAANYSYETRPVIFLKQDIKTSGDGSLEKPFILES